MDKKWNAQTLSDLRIHELRDIARKIGVQCPTALKKEDLIERSLKILAGSEKPYVASSKKGRPIKGEGRVANYLPEDFDIDNLNYYNLEAYNDFNYAVNMPEIKYNAGNEVKQSGVVEVFSQGFAIVRVNKFYVTNSDCYVNNKLVEKYNLKTGDFINCLTQNFDSSKPSVVTQILSVNKFDYNLAQNVNINYSNVNILPKTLNLVLTDQFDTTKAAQQFFKDNSKFGYNLFVSALNKSESVFNKNVDVINLSPLKPYNQIYTLFNTAINYAANVATTTNVLLVIDSISSFYSAIEDMLCDKIANTIKLNGFVKQELFKILEQFENKNITVVIFDSKTNKQNISEFLNFDLARVVNNFMQKS